MKNVYFLSDAHLGSRAIEHGRTQERRLVNFLDSIKHKASAVYLLGDMFDFWYEFRLVVPKGYTRFLGKISDTGEVVLDMTLTAPNCPAADFIMEDIRQKVESVEGVTAATINLVFEPEWDKDMMSEEAKLELGFL